MSIELILWLIIGLLLAHIAMKSREPKLAGIGQGPAMEPWQMHEIARLRLQLNNVFGVN